MISDSIQQSMMRDFAIIHPEMPVVEATAILIKKPFVGGPVVDEHGILQGWISEQECLNVYVQVLYHNQRVNIVGEIMRKDVLTVKLDDDILSLATQMLGNKPKAYPVVDDNNRVLGVINRRRVLQLLDNELSSQAVRS